MSSTFVADENLGRFLREMRRYHVLDADTERQYAEAWQKKRCPRAADQLVGSHLRLVVKVAKSFRGYGLPLGELVAEGNVGLMQAIERFEPERGFRLSTYAMWWIRANIQEYVLRSWSMVKLGTTSSQKKLFFNLRRLKAQLEAIEDDTLRPEHLEKIARDLKVSTQDVEMMNQRLFGRDQSLNTPVGDEDDAEWQDWLEDDNDNQETHVLEMDLRDQRRQLMAQSLARLDERERDIIINRRLREDPPTLESLSEVHGISRERVRQIEVKAVEKLKTLMRDPQNELASAVA
ncbi:MAG: RNA polymerase sigma factor RpoH [Alphaproteobacteria bacterium]|nr:RNA polymerase sigma factor RpoH [Alphaproteobacteria bacterium]